MTDWGDIISYSLGGALVLLMTFGIAFSVAMPALDRWSRRYFVILFSLLLLYVIAIFVDVLVYKNPEMMNAEKTVVMLEYLFFSVLALLPMSFLLHCCGENIRHSKVFRAVVALWGVFCVMLTVAQFTDIFYYATSENKYFRGPCYALLLTPLVLIMILNIGSLIKKRKKLSQKYLMAFLVYMLPMTIAIIIYLFTSVDILVLFVIVLCALTMFGLIISDNLEQYLRQQREIANQRTSVMVLQMRPHFIYNTMMGIYYLCDQNPQKAKQVTLDFTTYLRKNFTALAREDTIPFREELEHTRAYLAVEQAQFEDVLFVSFDTPHTMFRVPPLTLQPIVENAVKHGMKSSSDPIHISVVTQQTDTENVILVEDDGPGFKLTDDNEPHVALDNIRQRLALMCGGKLIIETRQGGGTLVKVTIPVSNR